MNKIDELTHDFAQLAGQLEQMHKELIQLRYSIEQMQLKINPVFIGNNPQHIMKGST
jgi:uncharacterized coiled-coil DUF342 family protein